MRLTIAQVMWRNSRVISLAADYVLPAEPLPGWPHGRKALLMSDLWCSELRSVQPGVLWLDPDMAADPDDLAAMTEAVQQLPGDVHTGLAKGWPASTGRPDWIWSHRGGTLGAPAATQDETTAIAYISTCFLWTPARLLDLAFPAHDGWQWAEVDVGLSELALANDIPMHAVYGCRPKHLHF